MGSLRKNVITSQFQYLVEYTDSDGRTVQKAETQEAESYEAGLLMVKSKYSQMGISAKIFEM